MAESLDSCPECEDLGVESTVTKYDVLATGEPVQRFRDAKGQYHTHDDINEYCYSYRCALGHEIQRQVTGKSCWCGWLPNELKKIEDALSLQDELGVITSDSLGNWEE